MSSEITFEESESHHYEGAKEEQPERNSSEEVLIDLERRNVSINRGIQDELRQHQVLDDQLADLEKEIRKEQQYRRQFGPERSSLKGVGSAQLMEEMQRYYNRQVDILERELQRITSKYDDVKAKSREKREEINMLRRQTSTQDRLFKQRAEKLEQIKNKVALCMEKANTILYEKNMIDDRIQQLEEKDEALEEEFRQDLNLLLNKIQTLYGQIDEEESGSASAESKTSITTQENSIKKRARELDEHIGDLQIKIQQIDEDMARIESAFDSLKEAAGETDIDKILEMFSEEEDINFSYFKYIQEAHKEADELLEKMAEIEKEMEKYQHEAEHSEHDRVSKLLHERKLLKNLEEENEQLEHTIKAAQQRVFNRVGPVVTKLAHTLQPYSALEGAPCISRQQWKLDEEREGLHSACSHRKHSFEPLDYALDDNVIWMPTDQHYNFEASAKLVSYVGISIPEQHQREIFNAFNRLTRQVVQKAKESRGRRNQREQNQQQDTTFLTGVEMSEESGQNKSTQSNRVSLALPQIKAAGGPSFYASGKVKEPRKFDYETPGDLVNSLRSLESDLRELMEEFDTVVVARRTGKRRGKEIHGPRSRLGSAQFFVLPPDLPITKEDDKTDEVFMEQLSKMAGEHFSESYRKRIRNIYAYYHASDKQDQNTSTSLLIEAAERRRRAEEEAENLQEGLITPSYYNVAKTKRRSSWTLEGRGMGKTGLDDEDFMQWLQANQAERENTDAQYERARPASPSRLSFAPNGQSKMSDSIQLVPTEEEENNCRHSPASIGLTDRPYSKNQSKYFQYSSPAARQSLSRGSPTGASTPGGRARARLQSKSTSLSAGLRERGLDLAFSNPDSFIVKSSLEGESSHPLARHYSDEKENANQSIEMETSDVVGVSEHSEQEKKHTAGRHSHKRGSVSSIVTNLRAVVQTAREYAQAGDGSESDEESSQPMHRDQLEPLVAKEFGGEDGQRAKLYFRKGKHDPATLQKELEECRRQAAQAERRRSMVLAGMATSRSRRDSSSSRSPRRASTSSKHEEDNFTLRYPNSQRVSRQKAAEAAIKSDELVFSKTDNSRFSEKEGKQEMKDAEQADFVEAEKRSQTDMNKNTTVSQKWDSKESDDEQPITSEAPRTADTIDVRASSHRQMARTALQSAENPPRANAEQRQNTGATRPSEGAARSTPLGYGSRDPNPQSRGDGRSTLTSSEYPVRSSYGQTRTPGGYQSLQLDPEQEDEAFEERSSMGVSTGYRSRSDYPKHESSFENEAADSRSVPGQVGRTTDRAKRGGGGSAPAGKAMRGAEKPSSVEEGRLSDKWGDSSSMVNIPPSKEDSLSRPGTGLTNEGEQQQTESLESGGLYDDLRDRPGTRGLTEISVDEGSQRDAMSAADGYRGDAKRKAMIKSAPTGERSTGDMADEDRSNRKPFTASANREEYAADAASMENAGDSEQKSAVDSRSAWDFGEADDQRTETTDSRAFDQLRDHEGTYVGTQKGHISRKDAKVRKPPLSAQERMIRKEPAGTSADSMDNVMSAEERPYSYGNYSGISAMNRRDELRTSSLDSRGLYEPLHDRASQDEPDGKFSRNISSEGSGLFDTTQSEIQQRPIRSSDFYRESTVHSAPDGGPRTQEVADFGSEFGGEWVEILPSEASARDGAMSSGRQSAEYAQPRKDAHSAPAAGRKSASGKRHEVSQPTIHESNEEKEEETGTHENIINTGEWPENVQAPDDDRQAQRPAPHWKEQEAATQKYQQYVDDEDGDKPREKPQTAEAFDVISYYQRVATRPPSSRSVERRHGGSRGSNRGDTDKHSSTRKGDNEDHLLATRATAVSQLRRSGHSNSSTSLRRKSSGRKVKGAPASPYLQQMPDPRSNSLSRRQGSHHNLSRSSGSFQGLEELQSTQDGRSRRKGKKAKKYTAS